MGLDMMEPQLLHVLAWVLVVVFALLLVQSRIEMRERAERMFEDWRDRHAAGDLERWRSETETGIRADAVRRSRAVVAGKVTEHLVPYLGEFPFNPSDVRFLGTPVDLVVFDGLSEGCLQEVVFVEVKTGRSASLSTRERRIRDAILDGRVRWLEHRIDA
jgi:predicted Holliday junction resolvase-like endonuclease